MADHHEEVLENKDVNYEGGDVNVKLFFGSLILMVVVTACSMALSVWIYNSLETRQEASYPEPHPLIQLRPTPPPPRLQPNIIDGTTAEEDMEAMRTREDAILETYGWVNRDEGIVRIPVDKAIDLLVGEAPEDELGR